ncbi:putative adenosine deaminase domain, adenosine/adenine deaminase, metal-dependent hydrolase [Septoria linicola]|nr:putative adenosine deaminase domain, adenosine/adenine deaminase, metal-dependent hydrolase [Septoria linicola]
MPVDTSFTRSLPKVELHAHLTGSISPACLHSIWQNSASSNTLQDPSIALKPPGEHHDVYTFFKIFDTYIYGLVNTPETVRLATWSVLQGFKDDGVKYLELRTTPRECVETRMTKEGYLEGVLGEMERFNEEEGRAGEGGMRTCLILSVDRRNTLEQAMRVVELAVKYRARGVVGVDLCGNPLVGPIEHLKPAFERARECGFKITLHFAEVPASSTEAELEMLLAWRPDRIGHVIHTSEAIEEKIERMGVGLELCLSCNVHAKMLPDEGGFAEHHFGKWKERRNAIALSTDDVGVFGSPLSHEYLLAAQHFYLSKPDLIELSRRAVSSIFGDIHEKARLQQLLDSFEDNSLPGI